MVNQSLSCCRTAAEALSIKKVDHHTQVGDQIHALADGTRVRYARCHMFSAHGRAPHLLPIVETCAHLCDGTERLDALQLSLRNRCVDTIGASCYVTCCACHSPRNANACDRLTYYYY